MIIFEPLNETIYTCLQISVRREAYGFIQFISVCICHRHITILHWIMNLLGLYSTRTFYGVDKVRQFFRVVITDIVYFKR